MKGRFCCDGECSQGRGMCPASRRPDVETYWHSRPVADQRRKDMRILRIGAAVLALIGIACVYGIARWLLG